MAVETGLLVERHWQYSEQLNRKKERQEVVQKKLVGGGLKKRKGYGKSLKQGGEDVWLGGGMKFRAISTANCACVEKGAQSLLRKLNRREE
ncbi:hypothetical protein K0M31_008888 [Melipona bicolor]|uniref:Uncharacterized protein n=1 Tax=Melipona bicolor TaxID=60889 RepID=A0AA40FQ27_9HYME|nr:hypothetical protein K0M31_008888 [Melipona bicolor]